MEDNRKPIISLRFEIEDIHLQYTAIQKYIETLDESTWEHKHATRIKTELYRVIIHHKFHYSKGTPDPEDTSESN